MRSPVVLASHSMVAFETLKDIHHHDLRHTGGVRGLVGASRTLVDCEGQPDGEDGDSELCLV